MKKTEFLIALFLILITTNYAQDCNCLDEYRWVNKTFVENDAGYAYYVQKYGIQAIEFNNQKWEKEFANTKDKWQCLDYLNEWLRFYRKGHLSVEIPDQTVARPAEALNENLIPKLSIRIDSFEQQTRLMKDVSFEGVWSNGTYKVGIKRVNNQFVGFVISSSNDAWKAGQIKFTFPAEQGSTQSIYYMGDHSKSAKKYPACQLVSKSFLNAFDIYWKRISPDFGSEPNIEEQLSYLNVTTPFIKKLDTVTTLIRIPSFDNIFITTVDSIVKSNHDVLSSSKNLIIDIRGNGGGADRCYDALTPYLYTNPIRIMWVDFLSTPLNNSRYDWIIKLDGLSENDKQRYKTMQSKLNASTGKFVNLNESNQTCITDTLPEVYQNPQQVAILIDGANASTAEQFILMAKQSKKVKLFGQKTAGALDFSNLNDAISPSKNFKFSYATSRSYRIPGMEIDDYGIQPDYFLDETIPPYKWIEFASETIKAK